MSCTADHSIRVPGVGHYLIVDPDKPMVVHHARGDGDTILTRIVTQGAIQLDPPGVAVALADVYAGYDLETER